MTFDRINRARGCLLGLAIGDAIGTTVEFKNRGSFPLVTDMVGGGPFKLKAGQWTDDTSMALCLGASLLENGFDLRDQITRYVRWYREGYMSSTGICFDIGMATREALNNFEKNGMPEAGSTDPRQAGNGCIMRLAPVPIMYLDNPAAALSFCVEQSLTTHGTRECLEACGVLGGILLRSLHGGMSKVDVLLNLSNDGYRGLSPRLKKIAEGQYFEYEHQKIKGSGYIVESLEAALWCFYTTDNFKSAVLAAANLGDDADTTAAITGQIAGAYYGESDIPKRWRDNIYMSKEIGIMAEQLSQCRTR
jgi:ADP-ribosyl-[dinitrogen reductase] hydrolase